VNYADLITAVYNMLLLPAVHPVNGKIFYGLGTRFCETFCETDIAYN